MLEQSARELATKFNAAFVKGYDPSDPEGEKKGRARGILKLPQPFMRSNSLELVGDTMVVAYQTQQPGQQPAGFEVFDIARPESPHRQPVIRLRHQRAMVRQHHRGQIRHPAFAPTSVRRGD